MKMTVKLNLHDWPKRGAFARQEVDVEAKDDVEAIQLGIIEGRQRWPGAKVKAYDVIRHKLLETTALTDAVPPPRPKLTVTKAAP